MSKASPSKHALVADVTYCKSSFTLTFAVEILGVHAWEGFTKGRLELGNYQEAIRLNYQLYPGQSFDIDILIWPHVAKIFYGNQYCFVRTWQFLEERWLTFSIRHAFPVRVHHMINHVATVTCAMGSGSLSANAKNDKSIEVFFPPLKFGERRYFGPVLEKEETIEHIMKNLLWSYVREYIPASHLDGIFDTPSNTTDVRHQDTILSKVQESILGKSQAVEDEDYSTEPEVSFNKIKERQVSKMSKDKDKGKDKKKNLERNKEKYTISLSGDAILAGSGRIVSFEITGERPAEQSTVIVIISSNNLPAEDDHPIIFVNVETLNDVPIQEFKKARISQIFTRWNIGHEEHDSLKQAIKVSKTVRVNDHHAVPLQFSDASGITASFLDKPFKIKLIGVRQSKLMDDNPILFGNGKHDWTFGSALPLPKTKGLIEEVQLAETRIDASSLAKAINGIVRGEFCLYPLNVSITDRSRENSCTNDINGIKQTIIPEIIIQPSVILQAQMTLEVSIGVVGCRPLFLAQSYLRLYCCASDTRATNALLKKIMDINENLMKTKEMNDLLTGFAIDTIDEVVFYVEGQRDGPILTVWEFTADFYPQNMKPLFSCTDHHLDRIYGEMLSTATPFYVLKMLVPINTLLACPQVYVKPSLPLPTRSALLKIGRLIASKFKTAPYKSEMPSTEELKSFRLELCVPPRPHREALLI